MKLSDGEKLILVMLSEIYSKLKVDGEIDGEFVKSAITTGNVWGLKWRYQGVFEVDEPDREIVSETGNILDMWYFMESAYSKLSKEDKKKVADSGLPFAKDVKFRGFDGNNECEYISVAHFLINHLGRFTHFKDRALNAHMPTIDAHRRMFEKFEPMRSVLGMGGELGAEHLLELMRAAVHPENRKKAS